MYYKCCVPYCDSLRQDVKLHQFPSSQERYDRWLQKINSVELISLNSCELFKRFVCQKHFEKQFVTSKGRLLARAYPSLFTSDEISTGIPSVSLVESVPLIDHNYSRKRHYDHTYCKSKPLIAKSARVSETVNKEDNISLESDDSELNNGDEAILYLTQVDENDPDEDNLVYLKQINSSQPTNEDNYIPYLQEVTNNVLNIDGNIGSLPEVDGTVVIKNGNMLYLPEVDKNDSDDDSYISYLQEVTNNALNIDGNIGSLPEVDDTVVIENGNMVYLPEVDKNDPDDDSYIPYLQEDTNNVLNIDGNIGSLPEVDGTLVIENGNMVYLPEVDKNYPDEDSHIPYLQEVTNNIPNIDSLPEYNGTGNFFYSAETDYNKVTEDKILENKGLDMSHVSNMCRTCLCVMDENRVHLENEVLLEQPAKLTEMLVSLGCVMDFGDNNWSKYICMECTKSLVSAYTFKMKCLSSTQTLLHELTTIRSQHMEKNNTTTHSEEYQPVLEQIVVQDTDCNESYEPEKMDVDKETDMDDNCIMNEEYLMSVEVRESIRCIKKDCDKKFAKVKSLIHHLAQYHPDDRRSFCEQCSIGCTSEKRLKEWFIKRHKSPSDSSLKENRLSGTFPKCKGCGRRFTFNTPKSRSSLQAS